MFHPWRICLALLLAAGFASADNPSPHGPQLPPNQLTEAEKDQNWQLLFNGKDLDGCKIVSSRLSEPAKWEAVDGVVRGTQANGYLVWPEVFSDFVLSLNVRVYDTGRKRRGNSGVFFRCREDPNRKRPFIGYEAQVDHGDPKYPTGAIWEIFEAPQPNIKDGQWFHMTIWAVGDRLTTWVNERPTVDAHETKRDYRSGYTALQVHHSTDVVEARNIKIRPLKAGDAALGPCGPAPLEEGFTRIFDGKTLSGWHTNPERIGHGTGGRWTVADGAVIGEQDPPGSGNGGVLLSNAKYGDSELIIETNPDYGIDSGVFLRSSEKGHGYQIRVDYRNGGNVGGLYTEGIGGFRAGFLMPHLQYGRYYRAHQWNLIRARITGQPPVIDVWLNGSHVTHWEDTETRLPKEGSIALQVHGGKGWPNGKTVRFRNICIKPLP